MIKNLLNHYPYTYCLKGQKFGFCLCLIYLLFDLWPIPLNTQYMRKSTIIYLVKMECGWFLWLKASVMICPYTTKNIFEIPPCAKSFSDPVIYFIKERILDQNDKFSNKNDIVKGQLISKANIKVFIWTKKRTKYFCISALASISGQINEI